MKDGETEKCEGCGKEYSAKSTYTPDEVMLCPECARENTKASNTPSSATGTRDAEPT